MKLSRNCGLVVALCLGASIASADTLELKNGSLIKGKFVSGTENEISFQVGFSVQKYPVAEIGWVKFDSDRSTSEIPKQPESSLPDAPRRAETPEYVVIPAGTHISVRTIDGIDSTRNQRGDRFQASLEESLIVDGNVVVARGAEVDGRLIESRESGTFNGKSQLELELTEIAVNGRMEPITTGAYDLAGNSRGKSTAKRTIGGAALGSIIGAIAGGGEGAAIGAGAGAAVGAGSEIITKGDQVRVPSETLLDFTLQRGLSVMTSRDTAPAQKVEVPK